MTDIKTFHDAAAPRSRYPLLWRFVALVGAVILASCSGTQTLPRGTEIVEESSAHEVSSTGAVREDIQQSDARPLMLVMPEINEAVRLNARETQAIPASLGVEGILSARNANNLPLARSIAERTRTDAMSPQLYGRYAREYLELLVQQDDHAAALKWAERSAISRRISLFSESDSSRVRELLALSHEAEGSYWSAAQLRYELAADENRFSSRRKNDASLSHRDFLWRDLLQLDVDQLRRLRRDTRSNGMVAWLELAAIVRDPLLSIEQQSQKVQQWQRTMQSQRGDFAIEAPRELGLLPALESESWQHVVALLPLTGKLASAGKAIQDGMLAAKLRGKGADLRLTFVDSNAGATTTLIEQAKSLGADIIVGPLAKANLRDLANVRSPVPVLALNYLDDAIMPANIAQFGLASEDEARDLAATLSAANAQRVLLLHSDKDWATRAANSFASNWNSPDKHLSRENLGPERGYNDIIQRAFAIDQSEQRKSGLQSLLGKRLEFQTRRRQDIDAVVVFANARQLATIKPLLAYHYAGDIPVLAASQINSGQTRTELRDLNGIIFKDAPFLLEKSSLRENTKAHYRGRTQLQRLFAMGLDAYLLAQRLPLLMGIEQGPIKGATGQLQLVSQRFERKMDSALIARSRIVAKSEEAIIAQLKNQ